MKFQLKFIKSKRKLLKILLLFYINAKLKGHLCPIKIVQVEIDQILKYFI